MAQLVLENVTFSYVSVFKTRTTQSGAEKYGCCILIDKKSPAAIAAKEAQDTAIKEGITKGYWTAAQVPSIKLPIRDGDKELATEDKTGEEWKNRVFINANAGESNPPGIVKPENGKAVPITDPLEFYSGCKGHCQVSFFPYKVPTAKGVAVGLNSCYKLADGDRLDGRVPAEKAFESFAEKDSAGEEDVNGEGNPFN